MVKDSDVEIIGQPGTRFSEHTTIWQNGKVLCIDERSSRKI
ncbi:hypothetical protein [Priestia taiwanensis]